MSRLASEQASTGAAARAGTLGTGRRWWRGPRAAGDRQRRHGTGSNAHVDALVNRRRENRLAGEGGGTCALQPATPLHQCSYHWRRPRARKCR